MTSELRPPRGNFTVEEQKWREAVSKVASLFLSGATGKGAGVVYDWVPTFTCSGSMTYTGVTITKARYMTLGPLVWIQVIATGTTGGVASTSIYINDVPVPAASVNQNLACTITDSLTETGTSMFTTITQIQVRHFDVAAWDLGAGRVIRVNGVYEAA